jgi:integrase
LQSTSDTQFERERSNTDPPPENRNPEKAQHRAGAPYFSLYELRHTFATRLSAGGVADHFVTQMLRQGDAGAFKRYNQAKLNMMREAITRLGRKGNEHELNFGTGTSG